MATKTQVNTDSVQTLTNKTLTSPILNGATCGANPTVALGVATKQYVDSTLSIVLPPGVMFPYGGATPPTGFLICDGTAVSRTQYAALFSIVSTTYGSGDGATTFNLPDKRGRTSIGAGTGAGLTNRTRGTKIGEENVIAPLPSHTHSYDGREGVGVLTGPGGNGWGGLIINGKSTTAAGAGDGTHANMQPSEVDTWIIKT